MLGENFNRWYGGLYIGFAVAWLSKEVEMASAGCGSWVFSDVGVIAFLFIIGVLLTINPGGKND